MVVLAEIIREHPIAGVLLPVPAVVQADVLGTIIGHRDGFGRVLDLLQDRVPPHH